MCSATVVYGRSIVHSPATSGLQITSSPGANRSVPRPSIVNTDSWSARATWKNASGQELPCLVPRSAGSTPFETATPSPGWNSNCGANATGPKSWNSKRVENQSLDSAANSSQSAALALASTATDTDHLPLEAARAGEPHGRACAV